MGAEPRQFSRCAARFLWIFHELVQPGCFSDRPWTHIPGYTGQLPIFAILHNFFLTTSLAVVFGRFLVAGHGKTDRLTGMTSTL